MFHCPDWIHRSLLSCHIVSSCANPTVAVLFAHHNFHPCHPLYVGCRTFVEVMASYVKQILITLTRKAESNPSTQIPTQAINIILNTYCKYCIYLVANDIILIIIVTITVIINPVPLISDDYCYNSESFPFGLMNAIHHI